MQQVLNKDIFTCPTQPLLAESALTMQPGMLKSMMTNHRTLGLAMGNRFRPPPWRRWFKCQVSGATSTSSLYFLTNLNLW